MCICACSSNSSSAKDEARQSIQSRTENPAPVPPSSTPVAGNVKHYVCADNCVGSGGDVQGNCPVCGKAYVHNQAFHNQPTNPSNTNLANPATNTVPAQNASGEYHYTCSDGHAGSGTQGNCSVCGKALVHNTAYHN